MKIHNSQLQQFNQKDKHMGLKPTPESKFHDVITSFITLYRTSIKDLLEMDSVKRKKQIKQMRMISHWMHVMEEIAIDIENERV